MCRTPAPSGPQVLGSAPASPRPRTRRALVSGVTALLSQVDRDGLTRLSGNW